MTRRNRAAGAHAAFIAELRALHKRCGKPAYKQLAAISEDLSEMYPLEQGDRYKFVPLSPAAISEILSGKRANLPKLEWVASFVLSCQRWAHRIGATTEDPGPASVPEWAKRWAAAQGDDGDATGADDGHPPQAGPHRTCVVRLTPGQREFLASNGTYGRALADQAEAGSLDAVYDAALLLGTSPAHRDDAGTLLLVAAAAGHRPSSSLLDDNSGRPAPFATACLARARKAEAEGRHDQARAFDLAAARGRIVAEPTPAAGHGTGQQQNGPSDPSH